MQVLTRFPCAPSVFVSGLSTASGPPRRRNVQSGIGIESFSSSDCPLEPSPHSGHGYPWYSHSMLGPPGAGAGRRGKEVLSLELDPSVLAPLTSTPCFFFLLAALGFELRLCT